MKKNNAIIFGILVLIAGLGLLFFAFMPNQAVFTVPIWKWFLAAAIIYWMVKKIVFSKTLANRLSVFLPLALGFMLFESEIGTLAGKGTDFVNNWIVLAAALLMDGAIWIIFRPRAKKFFSEYHSDSHDSVSSGKSGGDGEPVSFKLGSHIYYVDATTQSDVDIINQLGELKIIYQNTDTGDTSEDLCFNLVNQMGETTVYIPKSWHVDLSSDVSMGAVNCRPDSDVTTRTITVRIKNQMGEVNIVSDD